MKAKVLFVVLPYLVNEFGVKSFHAFPYGVLSIASYCKDLAEIRIEDMNAWNTNMPLMKLKMILQDFEPDIVGFSMMFDDSYEYLNGLLEVAKAHSSKIYTILGGAAASYEYEDILKEQPNLDAICFGEGEIPFRRVLLNNKPWTHPSAFATRFSLKFNPPCPEYVVNLDDVIDLDYSFVNPEDYNMKEAWSPFAHKDKHKQFFLSSSRGCPFRCAFCSATKMHGKRMRFASVDKIIEHVGKLVKGYGMDVLTFYDDQLLIDKPRAKEIFRQLAQFNLRIEMPNGLSVVYLDAEMAKLMKAAGVDTVYLAIESGSEYVLKHLINKPLKLSMVKPAIEVLHEAGLFVHGFFVMGMPGETSEHRKETERFIIDSGLDWAGLQMALPMKGSRLYEQCVKEGWIEPKKTGRRFSRDYIIHVPGSDPKEVEEEVYKMNLNVNFVHNRRMKVGDWDVAKRCFENVLDRDKNHAFAHWYLGDCLIMLDDKNAFHHNFAAIAIMGTDKKWAEYAKLFNIGGQK